MPKLKRGLGAASQGVVGGASRRSSLILEPRILLDAAAVATATAEAVEAAPDAGAYLDGSDSLLVALDSLQIRELVIIDGAVDGAAALASNARADGKGVLLLESGSDGLDQILSGLSAYSGLSAIHIVSHAADGRLMLGNTLVTEDTLAQRAADFSALGSFLSADADILLYGCDLASDAGGQAFINSLSALTGADVAASDDISGVSGDWDLEFQAGTVEVSTLAVMESYLSDLNLDGVVAGTEVGATSSEFGSFVDADGPWVVAGGGDTSASTVQVKVWFVNGATRTPFTIARPDTTNWSTQFGHGVAIDADTATLVIADPGALTGSTDGRLAIYQFNGSTWVYKTALNIPNGSGVIGAATTGYGADYLALDGRHIAVGAPGEGSASGRVYWFADSSAAGDWSTFNSGLIDEPEGSSDSSQYFGAAVAIAKDYFVVSAPGQDTDGSNSWGWSNGGNNGRVYVYSWGEASSLGPGGAANGGTTATRYTTGSWSHLNGQADMDGLNNGQAIDDSRFGAALALDYYDPDGTGPEVGKYTLVAGAPGDGGGDGKVFIYQTTNSDMATLGSNADTTKDGAIGIYNLSTSGTNSRAGSAVDVSQGRIMVGAYLHTTTTQNALWYFEAPNNNWNVLQSTNNDVDASVSSNFVNRNIGYKIFTEGGLGHVGGARAGYSVALAQGNIAVVGTPYYNSGANLASGGVDFVFIRTPVAADDVDSMSEDLASDKLIDILKISSAAGTPGKDILGTESVAGTIGVSNFVVRNITVNGFGTASWNGTHLVYNQGLNAQGQTNYNYLGDLQTATVTINYELAGNDFVSRAKVTLTINGVNDAPVFVTGSFSTVSDNRRIDTDGNGVFESNGGTVGLYTGGPTPFYQIPVGYFYDPDQDAVLTYDKDPGVVNSLAGLVTVSSTGVVTWSLTTAVTVGQTYNIGIRVTDNKGAQATGVLPFLVLRDDVRPEKTPSAPVSLTWGEDVAASASVASWFVDDDFTNGNGTDESLSYSVSYSGPGAASGWLSIRSDTGLMQGTPGNDNVGTTTVTVTATDKYGQRISHTFNLIVTNVNDAPIVQGSIDPVLADQGVAFSFQLPGFNTSGTRDDDLFRDVDNPANTTTYTAELVDANGNLIRTIGSTASGSGAGSWLTFSGGSIAGSGVVTGSGTFGGTSNDPIGTLLYVRVKGTDNGSPAASSTYTFTIQTFAPTLVTSPLANGAAASELGTSVSISRDGNFMVVGAPNANEKGGVSIYSWNGSAWTAMTFTVPVGLANGDRFGQSVALDWNGDRLLVGAPGAANGAGMVYAFTRSGTTWAGAATYTEVGTARVAGDGFGSSLAFYTESNNANDGQSFLVGAPFDSDGGLLASGKAFLFGWAASGAVTSTAAGTLAPATDAGETTTTYDLFGYSLAYDGNVAVIGSPYDTVNGYLMAGSATVVGITSPNLTTASFTSGVRSKLSLGTSAALGDMFGMSVDIELFDGIGNAANTLDAALVAVGAPGRDVLADDHGAVYLYRADALTTSGNRATTIAGATLANGRLTQMTAFDGRSFQYFGWSVALAVQSDVEVNSPNNSASTRLMVGSQQTADRTGAIYMYKYTTAWNGQRYIPTGTGNNAGSMYGRAVDISSIASPRWVTGAPYSGATSYEGRVYTGTATASATPLSLDAGSDTLDPMGASGGEQVIVPMSLTTTSTEDTSLQSMEMASADTVGGTGSGADATGSGTTSSTGTDAGTTTTTETAPEQSFSDLLLMDMMTTDPLATDAGALDPMVAMNNSVAPWAANGLSRQLQLLQARRERGVDSLLDRLERLVG